MPPTVALPRPPRPSGAALLLAALLGWTAARPHWLEALGVEFPAAPRQGGYVVSEPDPAVYVLRLRYDAKQRVIGQLEAEELTLWEAAEEFRRIDGAGDDSPAGYGGFTGDSEGERRCRQVIGWVGVFWQAANAPAAEVRRRVARLEAELSEEVRRRATLAAWMR